MRRYQKTPSPNDLEPENIQGGKNLDLQLNLRLTGFSNQPYFALDEIIQAIDSLPNFHLCGLREIEYLTKEEAYAYLAPDGLPSWLKRKAEFVQSARKVTIFGVDDRDLFHQVLFHEIGHYVYFLIISSTLKQYWVTQVYPGSPCVTQYGTANAAEDFAETYACYVRAPHRLQQIPSKYSFMHNLVFSGDPITLKERSTGL